MEKNVSKNTGKLYEYVLLGMFAGLITTFVLLLFFALILTLRDFSPAVTGPLSTVSLGVGALVAGYVTAYKHRVNGLLVGLLSGGLSFLFYTVIALALGSSFSVTFFIRLAVSVVTSALGGILGVNKATKRKIV